MSGNLRRDEIEDAPASMVRRAERRLGETGLRGFIANNEGDRRDLRIRDRIRRNSRPIGRTYDHLFLFDEDGEFAGCFHIVERRRPGEPGSSRAGAKLVWDVHRDTEGDFYDMLYSIQRAVWRDEADDEEAA